MTRSSIVGLAVLVAAGALCVATPGMAADPAQPAAKVAPRHHAPRKAPVKVQHRAQPLNLTMAPRGRSDPLATVAAKVQADRFAGEDTGIKARSIHYDNTPAGIPDGATTVGVVKTF